MAKAKIIAAIDVGSSKIATLIAQHREDEEKLHIIGVAASPSKGVRKGQVVNIEETVEAIVNSVESAERMAGFNVSKAWVLLDGAHIGSQNSKGVVAVSQPHGEINADDVRRVMEAAKAVSLPTSCEIVHVVPRSFTVDGQTGIKDPIGMTGVRLEVDTHIVTGSSTTIKNLVKCVSEVGCDVAGLVFGGLASGESCLTDTERELGVVLVDIGGGTTSLAIYVEGALSYSAVLPVGAKNVTNDLAIGLRVSLESSEKIKLFLTNHKNKDKEDDLDLSSLNLPEDLKTVSYKTVVEGIIRPRLNELFTAVSNEIRKSGLAAMTPAGLVLCGGGAMTVGIVEAAKRNLSMPVRVGMPMGITGLVDDIENPSFAASVGLLKYGLKQSPEESSMKLNLDNLPGKGIFNKFSEILKTLLP